MLRLSHALQFLERRRTNENPCAQLPLAAITSVRAMPEDEAPYASVELGSEHYYLEIATVRPPFTLRTLLLYES